jgi:hypothetical protein
MELRGIFPRSVSGPYHITLASALIKGQDPADSSPQDNSSEGRGRTFESYRVRHFSEQNQQVNELISFDFEMNFGCGSTTEADVAMAPNSAILASAVREGALVVH